MNLSGFVNAVFKRAETVEFGADAGLIEVFAGSPNGARVIHMQFLVAYLQPEVTHSIH